MIFTQTKLKGAYIIELEKIEDDRGFFIRLWDKKTFSEKHLNSDLVQCNVSFNQKRGTLRGLHYQKTPFEETKLVCCTQGKIFDVIVDLRAQSKTYLQWFGLELHPQNQKLLYVPEGFAHGYLTLEDNTMVIYHVSQYYAPDYEMGLRWNDPSFQINWPENPKTISKKDASWEYFSENI